MDTPEDQFPAVVQRILASPNRLPLLRQLIEQSNNDFEINFATAFAYRIQAVAPGLNPKFKADFYRRAADAFLRALHSAPDAQRPLVNARCFEHQAFALVAEAGFEDNSGTRISLYESACELLDQALDQLPSSYNNTRNHLHGWLLLCRAKALGMRADLTSDLCAKSALHRDAAALFECSAERFHAAGQADLAQTSAGWKAFSVGWSLIFDDRPNDARRYFQLALNGFHDAGRDDILTACWHTLQPLQLELTRNLCSQSRSRERLNEALSEVTPAAEIAN